MFLEVCLSKNLRVRGGYGLYGLVKGPNLEGGSTPIIVSIRGQSGLQLMILKRFLIDGQRG